MRDLCVPQVLFEEMDLDHDGIISGQQLHEGLAKLGTHLSERDVAEFLKVSKVRAQGPEGMTYTSGWCFHIQAHGSGVAAHLQTELGSSTC